MNLNKRGICIVVIALFIFILYKTRIILNSNTNEKINLKRLLEISIKTTINGGRQVVGAKENLNIKSKGLTKEGMEEDVTTADFLSHCSMLKTLKSHFSELHVISEEAVDCENDIIENDGEDIRLAQNLLPEWVDIRDVTVWIDPLDATHEYTEKLYEYVTTMVCVAVKGEPIIGVIHKPFSKTTSWAWVNKTKSNDLVDSITNKNQIPKIIISRSHSGNIKQVLDQQLKNYELVIAAGAGYKSLKVAKGEVNAYLHMTAIKKWDICAGNAILNSLGGKMTNKFDQPIDYQDVNDVVNEKGLVATLNDHQIYLKLLQN